MDQDAIQRMDLRAVSAREKEIEAELDRLSHFTRLTRAQDEVFYRLVDEAGALGTRKREIEVHDPERIAKRDAALQRIRDAAGIGKPSSSGVQNPGVRISSGAQNADDFPADQRRTNYSTSHRVETFLMFGGNDMRDQAMRQMDHFVRSGEMPAYAAERVEKLMGDGPPAARNTAARWAALTGSEAYRDAFAKLVQNPERAHLMWTPAEHQAFRDVAGFQDEQRAMSSTPSAGGYLVPTHLDPTVLLTNDGTNQGMRSLARVVQIAGDSWNGVSSAGATANWVPEAVEVGDDSPVLAQPTVPAHKLAAWIPWSLEVGGDAVEILSQVSRILVDAADNLTAQSFITGSGTNEPTGVVTALTGSASVVPAEAGALTESDPYGLQNALGHRFQANAQYAMALPTMNAYRSLTSQNGNYAFTELRTNPPSLLNRSVTEVTGMDGSVETGANNVALYGDFKRGYLIADRVGSTIELIPHLVGANGRPTGQRGAYLWARTGGQVIVPEALRMLAVTAV